MLIRQTLVVAFLLGLVIYVRKRGTAKVSAAMKIGFLLSLVFGVYAVLRPNDLRDVAMSLGIAHVTDLLLYAFMVTFAFNTVHTYLRFKDIEVMYTRLARNIAIRHAETPGHPAKAMQEKRQPSDVAAIDVPGPRTHLHAGDHSHDRVVE